MYLDLIKAKQNHEHDTPIYKESGATRQSKINPFLRCPRNFYHHPVKLARMYQTLWLRKRFICMQMRNDVNRWIYEEIYEATN